MRILGLDLSTTTTGYCILDDATLVTYGVIIPDEDLSECAKYYFISNYIASLLKIYRPYEISVEDTFFLKNVVTLKKLSRLAGQIMYLWFQYCGKCPNFYQATSCRKTFPNLGAKPEKKEIVDSVNAFFKLRGKIVDHNIADSIVTAYHHYTILNTKGEEPK